MLATNSQMFFKKSTLTLRGIFITFSVFQYKITTNNNNDSINSNKNANY